MEHVAAQSAPLWPLVLYSVFVLILVAGMVVTSFVLGQRHRERTTCTPYESGITPTGTARHCYPAEFYLVAMLFVVFDLESIFIFMWAVSLRETGWGGYAVMAVFIGVLSAALVYLWRIGALDWGTSGRLKAKRARGG